MNLIIYVNDNFEEERALFDLDREKVILVGDYYHDKIDKRIDGYLEALKDFNIYRDDVPVEWIKDTHKHYNLTGFYEN
jgi:DNA-binding LacI/PurR family transcriptional regulator